MTVEESGLIRYKVVELTQPNTGADVVADVKVGVPTMSAETSLLRNDEADAQLLQLLAALAVAVSRVGEGGTERRPEVSEVISDSVLEGVGDHLDKASFGAMGSGR